MILLALLAALVRPSGRQQRRKSEKGQRRRPDLGRYYGRRMSPLHPGEFTFRVLLIRPEYERRRRVLNLNRLCTSLEWDDSRAVLGGSMTLQRPRPDAVRSIRISRGHRVRLQVRWRRKWYRLWDMRVNAEPSVDRGTGAISISLSDDLEALRRNLRDWEYRKDAQHPNGWRAHQIALDVAKREGVRVGKLAKGKTDLEKIKEDATSGLAVIEAAYKQETDEAGRRYVVRFRNGRLEVVPFRRHQILYVIRGIESSATVEGEPRKPRPRTVIEAKGRVTEAGETKKIDVTIARRAVVERLGRSVWEKDYGRVASMGRLKFLARRDLWREIRVRRTAQISIPGIPFLERGDTVKWVQREAGWHGKSRSSLDRRFAFVTAVSHRLTHEEYTCDVTLSQRDPYLADERRRDREEREKKRRKRKGRQK